MKTHNLLASIAAALITSAALGAVSHNYTADFRQGPASVVNGSKVTNLAPLNVYPTAEEQRAASLLTAVNSIGIASGPSLARTSALGDAGQFSLIGSQLAMPYYSFGNKFGRISKE
jgi:hypothetical protein